MKRIGFLSSLTGLMLFFLVFTESKAQINNNFAPDRVIVRFTDANIPEVITNSNGVVHFGIPDVDLLNRKFSCLKATDISGRKNHSSLIFLLEFRGTPDIHSLVKDYSRTGKFVYAEPDFIGTITGRQGGDSLMPNDTYFSRQWSLYNDGTFSMSPAKVDADIDMTEGWTVEQGDSNIIVGIIDTGVKFDHPDLSGRIWNNYDEIPGNGIDDDQNNYIDDVRGWDFANNDNDPSDDEGHGSNVTGILGCNGNNAMGYAGVDWHCKLMILKGINSSNWGYYSWWISAIHYAVDNGARVINMSVAGTDVSQALHDGVDYALQNNVSIVACMGNSNNNTPNFPAAYPGVIAVGSTNPDDTRTHPFFWSPTSGSNYGSHISVIAPGNYIYGLDYQSNTNYNTYWGGTSQATPQVSGLAALILAQNTELTPPDIKSIIETTAQDQVGDPLEDTPGWDQYYGYGRVNAFDALTYVVQSVPLVKNDEFRIFPNPGKGKFTFEMKTPAESKIDVSITNLLGHEIFNTEISSFPASIDISDQGKGVYFIFTRTGNQTLTDKVIIE